MREEPAGGKNPATLFKWIWLVYFVHGMAPGFWLPALTNIFKAKGLGEWVPLVFMVTPFCALFSPLISGALADQRLAANRLFSWSSLLSAIALLGAFGALDAGWNPWWFLVFIGLYSLFSTPGWGLLATISLTHLEHGEKQYPIVRLGATLGWMAAGLITSLVLRADVSPLGGHASAVMRFVSAGMAFMLPHTPPLGRPGGWKSRLGLSAFSLMKNRDHCVFFVVTALFSIPLAAFYMNGPEMLRVLGDQRSTATMAIAQITEIAAMLLVGSMMMRYRVKIVLLWALGFSVIRFAMSSYAGATGLIGWHIGGLALHGMCYTFYFITAQVFLDRRVDPGMRGQAQGLLALVTSGLGPLVGAWVCGNLHRYFVTPDGKGWMEFWGSLSLMILVCFIAFALLYRGLPKEETST